MRAHVLLNRTIILVAMGKSILRISEQREDADRPQRNLEEQRLPSGTPQCLAGDSSRPGVVYCGTFEDGVWKSKDSGSTWRRLPYSFGGHSVTSLAVRPGDCDGAIYAGTEPSVVFRSEDGGATWKDMEKLKELPSSNSWSFPPRPETHHVRWIALDPHNVNRLYVAVEAGALLRSFDGGETWSDRVAGGPYDSHTIATHVGAPGRLYSAAGDGYFESLDGGESWLRPMAGLGRHSYLYSVAVDQQDPDTIIVSASRGPWSAYSADEAESHVYRKSADDGWKEVENGLPEPVGTTISALAFGRREFYAANNMGIYRSADSGLSWARLEVPWKRSHQRLLARSICIIEA